MKRAIGLPAWGLSPIVGTVPFNQGTRAVKVLEDAHLKLGSVLSDVLGSSGRAMLEAMIAGESDPQKLAELAKGTARKKRSELIQALHGRIRDHHRRLLKVHLTLVKSLQEAVSEMDTAVGTWLKTTMVSAAWAAVRVKGCYLQAQFLRLKPRRGAKKAILAVAASMLTAAYHMLKNGVEQVRDSDPARFTRSCEVTSPTALPIRVPRHRRALP